MIRILVIVNDQPYGSERPYNALRLAGALAKRDGVDLRVFPARRRRRLRGRRPATARRPLSP